MIAVLLCSVLLSMAILISIKAFKEKTASLSYKIQTIFWALFIVLILVLTIQFEINLWH